MEDLVIRFLKHFGLNNLYIKHRQVIAYLFFGVVTTIINILAFCLCHYGLKMSYMSANVVSWILAVLAAYITNKLWVFESHTGSKRKSIGEGLLFYFFRIVTLGTENGILFLMIDMMGANTLLSKIIANITTVVLNYVFSKLIIFKAVKE